MHEKKVSGEIMAIGWRDGSSGRFTGDISGLSEGYRWGDLEEQRGVLEVAHGSIALVVRAVHREMGLERQANPFAEGKDPAAVTQAGQGIPFRPGVDAPGGFPGGFPPGGFPPGGLPPGAFPPGGGPPWQASGAEFMQSRRQMIETKVVVEVDGEQSTGIYQGASGEMTLTVPNLKDAGYMVVSTEEGDLRLGFLEWQDGLNLVANLWVEGEKSTGIYRNAKGELEFSLAISPQEGLAKGPYSGTLWLEQEPAGT